MIKQFLLSIRGLNILLIILAQYLLSICWISNDTAILNFAIFSSTCLCLMAGYIENNILDYELDTFCKNKPKNSFLTSKWSQILVYIFYISSGLIFLTISIYTSHFLILLVGIHIIILLHLYNIYLKKIALIGNLSIATLCTISVLYPFIVYVQFEVIPYYLVISIFILTFCREWLKDIEDKECDHKYGYKTIPIITPLLFSTISLVTILIAYSTYLLSISHYIKYGLLLFPIIAIGFILSAKWHYASQLIKGAVFIGIVSIVL